MSLTRDQIQAQVKIIRDAAHVFLTSTCVLRRKLGEIVERGESKPNWSEPITLECRFINRSGDSNSNIAAQERLPAQITFIGNYRLQLPYDTIVSIDDRIEYLDDDNVLRLFDVIYVPPKHDMIGAFIIGLRDVR